MHRYLPGRPFPPYSFTPGHHPHPRSHPQGHSHGQVEAPVAALDPQRWRDSQQYLLAIDLFNHGYYWEAHEAWEGLWHAAGRQGPIAALLKGLIRLTAAGVKVRQGLVENVRSHGTAARALFLSAAPAGVVVCGLRLEALAEFAEDIVRRAALHRGDPAGPVLPVFDRALELVP